MNSWLGESLNEGELVGAQSKQKKEKPVFLGSKVFAECLTLFTKNIESIFFDLSRARRPRSVLHGKVVNIVLPVGLVLAAVLLLTYCHATA